MENHDPLNSTVLALKVFFLEATATPDMGSGPSNYYTEYVRVHTHGATVTILAVILPPSSTTDQYYYSLQYVRDISFFRKAFVSDALDLKPTCPRAPSTLDRT